MAKQIGIDDLIQDLPLAEKDVLTLFDLIMAHFLALGHQNLNQLLTGDLRVYFAALVVFADRAQNGQCVYYVVLADAVDGPAVYE